VDKARGVNDEGIFFVEMKESEVAIYLVRLTYANYGGNL
jgi:hypothetical protein